VKFLFNGPFKESLKICFERHLASIQTLRFSNPIPFSMVIFSF